VAEEFLAGYLDDDILIALHHALATQARVDARIDGAVNEVLLLVADFGQVILPFEYVHVAGAAATDTTAVVLELNSIIQGHIQHRFPFRCYVRLVGLAVFELEGNIDDFHRIET
jgi:hypothetical protein